MQSRIQNELRDSHLLQERIPPCCLLAVLLHGRHLGVIPVVSGYRSARPATEAPDPVHCYLRGRPCTAAPTALNLPTPHVPQPLLHWYAAYVPAGHLTDCQDGVADGAGPSECTAGVTPAPSENLGQDD